jgi:hypothetical protein
VFESMRQVRRGVRGGCRGVEPLVRGQHPRKKKFYLGKRVIYLGGFFRHMVFSNGFLFPVKELGFWTNLGHWVRVLDAAGSYMYIVL